MDIEYIDNLDPGVYVEQRETAFHREELEEKIKSIKKDLPWIERLDDIDSAKFDAKSTSEDLHNQIIEQAQRSLGKVFDKLTEMKIPYQRPKDYYAEMLKSDGHMEKLKKYVISESKREEMKMQVRKQREEQRTGKSIMVSNKLAKQAEKSEFLKNIKKFQKDPKGKDLKSIIGGETSNKKPKLNKVRAMKNLKYGLGGKKRDMRKNTSDSTHDVSSFDPKKFQSKPGQNKNQKNARKSKK